MGVVSIRLYKLNSLTCVKYLELKTQEYLVLFVGGFSPETGTRICRDEEREIIELGPMIIDTSKFHLHSASWKPGNQSRALSPQEPASPTGAAGQRPLTPPPAFLLHPDSQKIGGGHVHW